MRTEKIYVAILIGLLAMGYGWNIMLPQSIQIPLRQQPYFFTSMEFNLLYFCIFLPVLLFSIPFGTLIGKIKFSTITIVLQIFALLSSFGICLLFDMENNPNKIFVFILRGIYGLSNQGILTLRSLMMAKYFRTNYESILSIYFSISYFVSSGALSLSPVLYEVSHNVSTVWYAGSMISFISFLGGFFLFFKLRDIQNRQQIKKQVKINQKLQKTQNQSIDKNQNKNFQEEVSQNLSSSNSVQQEEKFQQQHLNAITNYKNPFWIIVLAVLFTLLAVLPIIDNLNEAFVVSYNIPYVTAGFILMTVTFLTGIFLVVIGIMHTKFPNSKRISFIIVSVIYFISLSVLYVIPTIHKDMSTPTIHYIFAFFFLIAKAASITILWAFIYTSVIYFVDEKHLGTAYGILLTAMGFGECIGPIINALILNTNSDLSVSYKNFFLYYTCISMIPILIAVWIKFRPEFDIIDQATESHKQLKNHLAQHQLNNKEQMIQRRIKSWIFLGVCLIILLGIFGLSLYLNQQFEKSFNSNNQGINKSLTSQLNELKHQSKTHQICYSVHFRSISEHFKSN